MIEDFCRAEASKREIELENAEWSPGFPSSASNQKLTFTASSGSNMSINFSREDVEDYPGRAGTTEINQKIKLALGELMESTSHN